MSGDPFRRHDKASHAAPTAELAKPYLGWRDRDYYLERIYPGFGNLAPRDVSSRAAMRMCDEGRGVGEKPSARPAVTKHLSSLLNYKHPLTR